MFRIRWAMSAVSTRFGISQLQVLFGIFPTILRSWTPNLGESTSESTFEGTS